MTNQVDVSELLQKLLDERYAQGRADGYDQGRSHGYKEGRAHDGWTEGRAAGYDQAVREMLAFMKDKMTRLETAAETALEAASETDPEPESEPDPETVSEIDPLRSYIDQPRWLRKALQYVRDHPGVTAHAARTALGNHSALYRLAELGLAEKRGVQFFLVGAECAQQEQAGADG
jgi:hypothetical protein